jgi:hypothetical protein
VDQAERKENVDRLKPKPRWGCLIAPLAVSILYVIVSRLISPSDWVDVTVGPLPRDSENFCLIAEDSRGVCVIPWYHSKVFPFTEDPFMSGSLAGGFWDFDNDGFITASVQWKEARRYGVLIHRRDDQWRLWWLEPREMSRPSIIRFIVGGGKADMCLPAEARAQVPSNSTAPSPKKYVFATRCLGSSCVDIKEDRIDRRLWSQTFWNTVVASNFVRTRCCRATTGRRIPTSPCGNSTSWSGTAPPADG